MDKIALQAVALAACVVIFVRAEPAINRMGADAPVLLRLAFVLLAAGSISGFVFIVAGHVPAWQDLILTCGIAVLLLCERRIRILTRVRIDKGEKHAQG